MPVTACPGAFGDDDVPPPQRRKYEIMSPKPMEELKALILSERPVATWSHYLKGKSYPCCRTVKCPWHRPGGCNARWKAYLAGMSFKSGKLALVEVTHGAALLRPEFKDKECVLCGKIITLYRRGKTENSPVQITALKDAETWEWKGPIPPAFDVVAALLDIWGNPFEEFNPNSGRVEEKPPDGCFEPDFDGR